VQQEFSIHGFEILCLPGHEKEDFMGKHIIMGIVLGLVGGILFSILWFGEMQLTTPMAYIHEASGALLGLLIGWITGLYKTKK